MLVAAVAAASLETVTTGCSWILRDELPFVLRVSILLLIGLTGSTLAAGTPGQCSLFKELLVCS